MPDLTLADGTVLPSTRHMHIGTPTEVWDILTAEVAAREKAEAQVEVLREALERIVMIEEAYHRGTAETGHIASQALSSPSPAVEELKKRIRAEFAEEVLRICAPEIEPNTPRGREAVYIAREVRALAARQ